MIVSRTAWLPGQVQSSPMTDEALQQSSPSPSPLAERLRQQQISANVKAAEQFFTRNLPPGWRFAVTERQVVLWRIAPIFTLAVPSEDYLLLTKGQLLAKAKTAGKRHDCRIAFAVERHDDPALMRQKLRLYQEIRRDIDAAYDRLRLKYLCSGVELAACAIGENRAAQAAREFLRTRELLTQKLEITPLYRIGTLYFFPQKNQCVTPPHDWYFTNTQYPAGEDIFPFEAREEITIILRNLDEIRLWQ